jgi:hypothetical protein
MNGGDLLLVGVVLVLGCAAFFVGVMYLIGSFLTFVGRGILAFVFPHRRMVKRSPFLGRNRVCPNPKCGEVESRSARYCGHCGTEMRD